MSKDAIFSKVWSEARALGLEAGGLVTPQPMIVSEGDVLGGVKPGGKSWYVSEGVCGFAWVRVRPANCGFAKWLVSNRLGRKSSEGGVVVWISDFEQSMERKERCAFAMAKHFREQLGIVAHGDSRMD